MVVLLFLSTGEMAQCSVNPFQEGYDIQSTPTSITVNTFIFSTLRMTYLTKWCFLKPLRATMLYMLYMDLWKSLLSKYDKWTNAAEVYHFHYPRYFFSTSKHKFLLSLNKTQSWGKIFCHFFLIKWTKPGTEVNNILMIFDNVIILNGVFYPWMFWSIILLSAVAVQDIREGSPKSILFIFKHTHK